jgi:predicted TIM-barrel fold metal-dependent hydrolase
MALRLVDAHTHLLPDRLGQAIRAYFVQYLSGDAFPYPPEAQPSRAALVAAGVQRCWSLPYVRRGGSASALNRWMAETWSGDSVVEPGATVHPEDDVAAVVDEALGLGLRLFRLHPLWERLSQREVPVVVHLGHSPAGPTGPDELSALETVATSWPRARIILAHLAAPSVREALALLRRRPSLHADLTPVVFHPTPLVPGDLEGLEERILFGSDVPNVGLRIEEVVAHVHQLGLSPAFERAVLAGNADRLIPPP